MAFVISVVFTGVLIPQILLVSFRKKLFDQPDARKIHHSAVPRLGGIAFMPVALFTIAFLLGVSVLLGHGEMVDGLRGEVLEFSFALCALILLYLVGMADDLIGVQYRAKFAVQILCAVLLVASGVWINNLYGLFGIHELPRAVGWPLTVFVVVFVINAVNLIDGIDGLASGLSGVALFFYGVVFIGMGRYMYAMLAFVTLGALVSFFYYNVFGNAEKHKKIFMGDTGSLTIGIILRLPVRVAGPFGRSGAGARHGGDVRVGVRAAHRAVLRRGAGGVAPGAQPQAAVHARHEPHTPQAAAGGHAPAAGHADDIVHQRGVCGGQRVAVSHGECKHTAAGRRAGVDGGQHLALEVHQQARKRQGGARRATTA